MNKKSSIQNLIQKEKDIINKYKDLSDTASNEQATSLFEELTQKHNIHISELQKYLER